MKKSITSMKALKLVFPCWLVFFFVLSCQTVYKTDRSVKVDSMGKAMAKQGLIVIEAESTKSGLGEWKLAKAGDENYVENASQNAYLEYLGGTPQGGDPGSPIEYTFKVKKNGNYRLIMQTSKRLEGARGDLCNDVWVKMSGDFQSATNLDTNTLKGFMKFFQEGSVKTPEKSWHWAYRAEKGKHTFFNLVYQLEKGEEYTLTIAGRSQRFSIDYLVLFNEDTISFEEAKVKAAMGTSKTIRSNEN